MKRQGIFTIVSMLIWMLTQPAYGGYFDRDPSGERPRGGYKGTAARKAEEAFLKGDYEEVVILNNNYSKGGSRINDDLEHITGLALLKLGRSDEARNCFTRVVNHSERDDLLDESYIGLADSYYLEEDYGKAIEYYENVLRYFPDSDYKPVVYYKLGECYGKTGNKSESVACHNKVVRLFPDSIEAKMLKGESSSFITYSVQVGSFRKWNNAKKLHDELKSQGFDVNIHTTVTGQSRFYRVRVGRYDKLAEAEDMARNLRNKGYPVKIYP